MLNLFLSNSNSIILLFRIKNWITTNLIWQNMINQTCMKEINKYLLWNSEFFLLEMIFYPILNHIIKKFKKIFSGRSEMKK